MEVVGPVKGLDVLELGCGEGRTGRTFIQRGARSVVGTDISAEMTRRAGEKNTSARGGSSYENLRYQVLDARDDGFALARPVDLVAAMYLLHYASTQNELERMCALIARNLRPGGRFVTYGVNPDYDHSRHEPRLEEQFGVASRIVQDNRCELAIGDLRVDFWQWSRDTHESSLRRAGLDESLWHPLEVDPRDEPLRESVSWYLDNPPCIVLSARKRS
jgi:SAM-dependent methyltransferase